MSDNAGMANKEYSFKTKVDQHDFGKFAYTVVYLPKVLASKLPLDKNPRLRINVVISKTLIKGALQPTKKGWYFMLSNKILKKLGLAIGDEVKVNFTIANQDAVDVPDDLLLALAHDPVAQSAWSALTPGRRRGFAYRVDSAKRKETRKQRIQELLELLYDFQPAEV
jgi:hypothetical protein